MLQLYRKRESHFVGHLLGVAVPAAATPTAAGVATSSIASAAGFLARHSFLAAGGSQQRREYPLPAPPSSRRLPPCTHRS